MASYKIVRHFLKHGTKRVVDTGLTLAQAQKHCKNPETSSSTCTSYEGKARTRHSGPWFDGYTEEKPKRQSRKSRVNSKSWTF